MYLLPGSLTKRVNDIDVDAENNVGLTGDGVISGNQGNNTRQAVSDTLFYLGRMSVMAGYNQ